jgi:uncharacterized protein (TIGR03086 family)
MTAMTRPTDAVALYRATSEVFHEKVHAIRDDQWDAPTPCPDWTVRDLVNHVAVEDMWAPHLLAGETMADVGDALDGDKLGSDPVTTWDSAVAQARRSVSAPGAAESTVHLSYGDDRASAYLMQLATDHLIHAWDLASAIGADQHLPDHLVQACADWFTEVEPMMRAAGAIGPRPPVADDADAQTRLLAAFGRRAGDWRTG